MTRATHLALALFLLPIIVPLGGCVHVPPYRRGALAHPTMLLNNPAGAAEGHVYAVQEGASGGGSGAEGGCGCN